MARRTRKINRVVTPPPDPSAPTKNELVQAQQDGEFAGRIAAGNMSSWDFDIDKGDTEGDRKRTMCDLILERTHKDIEGGGYHVQGAPRPPKFAPLQSAYWTGFDWSVKQRFSCICGGEAALDGMRRRNRRGKR